MIDVTMRTTCRACGGELETVLDFGKVALNAFPGPGDPPPEKAPIQVTRCVRCTLVQLRDTVDRDALFATYWYKSSVQPAMVASLKDAAEYAQSFVALRDDDTVVSLGCNDATELTFFPDRCIKVGVDPARNLAEEATSRCDFFFNSYFPLPSKATIADGSAKVILSLACMYDVEDLGAWCDGIRAWLADGGVWVAQVSYLPLTLESRNVGDFVHEHTSYFTLESLDALVRAHGLGIVDYQFNDVNGGSVRIAVRKDDHPTPLGICDAPSLTELRRFRASVLRNGERLREQLQTLADDGRLCLGLGASTKFNGLLSLFGIGPDLLPAVADRDPRKWGRTTVTGIPIVPEDAARARKPAVFLVGISQFLDAVVARERAFVEGGGRLLLPFPTVRYAGIAAGVPA